MLSDLKAEVENIIKSGRKMVEDNLIPDGEQYTIQLDQLKHLYNKVDSENIRVVISEGYVAILF